MIPPPSLFLSDNISASQPALTTRHHADEELNDIIARRIKACNYDFALCEGDHFTTNLRKECFMRNIDGTEGSPDMESLVDIVLLAADNAKYKSDSSNSREQKKRAAIRYREKRKKRWLDLQKKRAELEKTNSMLKQAIAFFTKEVAEFRSKILAFMPVQN